MITFHGAACTLQQQGEPRFLQHVARIIGGCAIDAHAHIHPRIQQPPYRSNACASRHACLTLYILLESAHVHEKILVKHAKGLLELAVIR